MVSKIVNVINRVWWSIVAHTEVQTVGVDALPDIIRVISFPLSHP